MHEYLISKTVYSLRIPEVNREIELIYNALKKQRAHDRPWQKSQDNIHKRFASAYRKWATPVMTIRNEDFHYFYPTAGSNEAIRDAIANISARNTAGGIHVFRGEYEGYKAYADAYNLNYHEYDRDIPIDDLYQDIHESFEIGDAFIISQPSSIDGMVWDGLADFLDMCDEQEFSIYLDLAYVGCTIFQFKIPTNKCIKQIFVSMSKSFGVYYHRIGGVFSRENIDSLYGSLWFKNIDSLLLGEALLNKFDSPYIIPRMVNSERLRAFDYLTDKLGKQVLPTNVVIIANIVDYTWEYKRYPGAKYDRVCITPILDRMMLNP